MAATQVINEPYRNYRFLVEIDGFVSAGFTKVSGLDMEHEVVEYKEGGENTTVRKLPGQTKFAPIVLERGATENLDMWNWAKKVHSYGNATSGSIARKSLTIVLMGNPGGATTRLRSWTVYKAWVSKWEMGELDAKGNDVLVERITIQHEGVKQDPNPVSETVAQ